ncbi:ThiF family adenylyltransferase [Candidatus Nanohalobium constans]|uniref:Molybdopterin-synthase adenylyltransferase n=1 Tax=Candidatus Nanohalobium constans TaxID=2565781 RepID=A0A5Q0UFB1_9ARCH|nr:ThiF family adenylyltransferase [Candidatus Nanohalobium constans]QGA80267.1 molybdopterin-synthase adenylyltransferase [Candidatus Nanohalobium constans]
MYSRFTTLQNHSEEDQERLENSTAAIIGLGATGSAIAENLARHGVNLIIIDRDYLEEKDAYSSSLYTPEQCEKALPKAKAAEDYLKQFTGVEAYSESFKPDNTDLIEEADIILDGTDNLETRQVINDYSKKQGIPWIYTAAIAEKAYSMPIIDKCFNCMVQKPQKVATCETDGVMREVARVAAAKSVYKAVKMLTGSSVDERLELVDKNRFLKVEDSGCEVCESEVFPHLDQTARVSKLCGRGKYQFEKNISDENIAQAVKAGEKLAENDYLVRIGYEGREITFFRSGRVIVEARDEGHAESLISEVAGI